MSNKSLLVVQLLLAELCLLNLSVTAADLRTPFSGCLGGYHKYLKVC